MSGCGRTRLHGNSVILRSGGPAGEARLKPLNTVEVRQRGPEPPLSSAAPQLLIFGVSLLVALLLAAAAAAGLCCALTGQEPLCGSVSGYPPPPSLLLLLLPTPCCSAAPRQPHSAPHMQNPSCCPVPFISYMLILLSNCGHSKSLVL